MMTVTNLGRFYQYQPEAWPAGFPSGVMFLRNEDGMDWFETVATLGQIRPDNGSFVSAIAGAFAMIDDKGVVTNVEADPHKLVPFARTVLMVDADPSEIEVGAIYDDVDSVFRPAPPPAPVVPHLISDRQFFQTLANRSLISKAEALAAVKVGELPAAMLALIGQILDEEAAFAVEMAISGATTFERDHPDTELLAYLYGWDDAALDEIWIEAGNLK